MSSIEASKTQSQGGGEHMQTNVGKTDKMVRIGIGVLLIVLAVTGTIGAWGWIGVIPLATGLVG
jgi:cytoskeletal protein RodZ